MQYIDIGHCIRVAQALKNVKNIDLANEFKVKPQQVIRWRNSEDMPFRRIQDLAAYFDMPLVKFLGLQDAKG